MVAIALSATPAQASPAPYLPPEFSDFKATEIDLASELESAEAQAVSVDLVESFAETLILESDSPTSVQTLPLSFSASPGQESGPEPWVATADSLMPLDQGIAVEETGLPTPYSKPALAQVRPANQGDGWEFVLEPYIFVPFNVTTEVTVGGITQSVSTGLSDILSLDRVFSGALRFEARHPQYGFFADVSHISVQEGRTILDFPLPTLVADLASLRTGQNIPPGTPLDVGVTATGRTTTLNVGGYYRAVDQFLGTTETDAPTYPRLLVDPYLGLRLVALSGSLDFDVTLGPVVLEDLNLSDSGVLVKPLLGARVGLELSDRWALGLQGDISGLAIGADESFAWSVVAGARYGFTNNLGLQLAYQYKDSRYRIGEGITQFGLDQSQHGLWLGLDIGL
jgi:hypothetical protein